MGQLLLQAQAILPGQQPPGGHHHAAPPCANASPAGRLQLPRHDQPQPAGGPGPQYAPAPGISPFSVKHVQACQKHSSTLQLSAGCMQAMLAARSSRTTAMPAAAATSTRQTSPTWRWAAPRPLASAATCAQPTAPARTTPQPALVRFAAAAACAGAALASAGQAPSEVAHDPAHALQTPPAARTTAT